MYDLTWKNVEHIKEGDKLIAFNEYPRGNNQQHKRKYEISTVIHSKPIKKDCSIIEMENGEKITVSNDHPWLVKRNGLHWKYRTTDKLIHHNNKINTLSKVLNTWTVDNNYHAGYLAAFLDGEGCIVMRDKRSKTDSGFSISFSQKDPIIIEKLKKSLDYYHFDYGISSYDKKHNNIMSIRIRGGFSEKIRFLGITQSAKNSRIRYEQIEKFNLYLKNNVEIKSITPIGKLTVIGLETSSKTYICDGYPVHNCAFDIKKANARFIFHGFERN